MMLLTIGIGTISATTLTFVKSQSLAAGSLSLTSAYSVTGGAFLASVAVNFSAAPASAETVAVYLTSRNGSNYDLLLAKAVTVAGVTTSLSFVSASTIPVTTTDQIKVTCTNNSLAQTAYASITVDNTQRSGVGIFVYRDGALIATSGSVTTAGATGTQVSLSITDAGVFSTTVTGQTWVTAASRITCSPFGTTADGATVELYQIAQFSVTVSDLTAGTGFIMAVYSPNGVTGTYRFNCVGTS